MMEKAEKLGKNLYLPIDTTITKDFPNPIDAEVPVTVVPSDAIPADMMGLDIGTATAEKYAEAVKKMCIRDRQRAKQSLRGYYWAAVAVCLIFLVLQYALGTNGSTAASSANSATDVYKRQIQGGMR